MKDLFTWQVDESRKLVLRDDQHWYCQDAGEPEKLWSVASVPEMEMAAEIEILRTDRDELAVQKGELLAEIDRMRPELIRLRLENARLKAANSSILMHHVADQDAVEPCRPDPDGMM